MVGKGERKMQSNAILEMKNITKTFPGVVALSDVSLSVGKGAVHVLVGENGAGKSTLIKIINGMYKADQGQILFDGNQVDIHTPKHMMDLGVATIHQELSPVLDMSIAENIFLGTEPRVINWKEMYARADKLIKDLGFHYDAKAKMRTLTVSDMQIIEIIKAISKNAKVIIMDEPTSSITESEVAVLFQQIRKLKASGIGIIYITHKMDEIFEIGDDASILRDGHMISSHKVKDLTKETIIAKMVGREMTEVYPPGNTNPGETILELKGLTRDKRFKDVSLAVRRGEILGIAGLIGAGRTEVFRSVFGLDSFDSGEIIFEGEKLNTKHVCDVIDAGIMMVSEDRKGEGLVLCRSVLENISLPNLSKYTKFVINKKAELTDGEDMIRKLNIKTPSTETNTASLSGGNQQKIVIAKWLLHNPKVLILDEPTRGIDVGAKYEIYKIMEELAGEGIAIIMISSEMPEIIGMCDRVAVMSNGKITGILKKSEMTQEKIMTLAVKGFENE